MNYELTEQEIDYIVEYTGLDEAMGYPLDYTPIVFFTRNENVVDFVQSCLAILWDNKMKLIMESWRRFLKEDIKLDIKVGDVLLGGRFKNKRILVKEIGVDDKGQPTINGRPILKFRIEKLLPDDLKSKKTKEEEKDDK